MKLRITTPGNAIAVGYTAAAILASTSPAFAQGLDVQAGTSTLVQALLVVFAILVLGITAFRGLEAVSEHRSIVPTIIGLVIGLGLTLGPAWFIGKMGGGGLIPL